MRPDYFGGLIPAGLVASTWTHNAIYIGLSFVLLILSTRSFRRARFLGESTRVWKNHLHLPALTFGSANLKMLWGGNVVAALVALFIAVANTFANNETIPQLRVGYAFLGLEFYLSFAALLLMGGVIARDKAAGFWTSSSPNRSTAGGSSQSVCCRPSWSISCSALLQSPR
ncbi:MAG TPA: hypothetical protein PKD55_19150 [Bellilinea sp.]|nr:hypothetical protein [Bellilinea sp.]